MFSDENDENQPKWLKRRNRIVRSNIYKAVVIYIFFAEDIRICFFPKAADIVFTIITILSFIFFIFDYLINLFPISSWDIYFLIYSVTDLVSTLTIVFDESFGLIQDGSGYTTSVIRGIRAFRVVRFFKLFRSLPKSNQTNSLSRASSAMFLNRLLSSDNNNNNNNNNGCNSSVITSGNVSRSNSQTKKIEKKEKQTKVGQVFIELAGCRVIFIAIVTVIGMQLIQGFTDFDISSIEYNVDAIHQLQLNYKSDEDTFKMSLYTAVNNEEGLIYINVCNRTCSSNPFKVYSSNEINAFLNEISNDPSSSWSINDLMTIDEIEDKYRKSEIIKVSKSVCYDSVKHQEIDRPKNEEICETSVIYNIKRWKQNEAGSEAMKTICTLILVAWTCLMFAQDANKLVIKPIERMMRTVNDLAANPLSAVYSMKRRKTNERDTAYETALLEKTLTKVGNLLCIGFGEAGAEIIMQNLGSDCSIRTNIAGRRVAAIFGFCDIRSFTSITECLQEDVLLFVNTISLLVHNSVAMFGGAPNKNIGDAFLLVWKLLVNPKMEPSSWRNSNTEIVASNALSSFIQSIISIDESNKGIWKGTGRQLKEFVERDAIRKRFDTDNYEVKVGYGLHVGWAIEGAIGTDFKIDASYLSKNANLAEQIQDLSPVYKIPIVMSGEFWYILPLDARMRCRHIDRVKFAGSKNPTDLYTFDITNLNNVGDLRVYNPLEEKVDYKNDMCITYLQNGLPDDYILKYGEAIRCYIHGDWLNAKKGFTELENVIPNDVPMSIVMNEMSKTNFIPPKNWYGHRDLN